MGWEEELHPRDERGRFGSGGSAALAPSDVKKWASKKAPNVALTSFAGTRRVWTEKPPQGMSNETWKDHWTGHPEKGGHPNPERVPLHDEIKKAAFEGKKTAAELNMKPLAILTMGGPASGKSVGLAAAKIDQSKFIHVDPDGIKEKIPEYKQAISDKNATYKGAAAMAHEESSYLAKQIRGEAIAKGHNVILDGTGAKADQYIDLIHQLEDKGYEVHVHYPHSDAETGRKRMSERAEKEGRYVPPDFVKKTYSDINQSVDRIMAAAPNFHMYDSKAPKGAEAPKIWSKEGGVTTVHDRDKMTAFHERQK